MGGYGENKGNNIRSIDRVSRKMASKAFSRRRGIESK